MKGLNLVVENDIQTDILVSLRKLHVGMFWRNNNVGIFDKEKGFYRKASKLSMKGISDILGCYQGRFVAIEVKRPDSFKWTMNFYKKIQEKGNIFIYQPHGEREEHIYNQIIFIEQIKAEGGIGFFTHSLDHTLKALHNLSRGLNES